MPPKTKKTFHLSSNEPVVFITQIMTLAVVIFMLAYVIFAWSWTRQQKVVRQQSVPPLQTDSGSINDQVIQKGVDESQFSEKINTEVDPQKLNTLFPAVK